MSIINKIISSVEAATELTCYYHSEGELDRLFDNAPLPCAFFTLLSEAEVVNDTSQLRERAEVAVFFCDKTEFDFGSMENESIISVQRANAFRWVNAINGSDISLDGDLRSSRIYDRFDCNVTGYGIRCTITENVGESKCKN